MLPETAAAVMAVAKLGAVFVPVFSGYGAEAVRVRLEDAGAKALITADAFPRRGKPVPMLATALEAAGATPTIVVVDRLGTDVAYDDRVAPVAAAGQRRRSRRGPSTASTRCSSPTRRARPAGPRASCTSTAAGR